MRKAAAVFALAIAHGQQRPPIVVFDPAALMLEAQTYRDFVWKSGGSPTDMCGQFQNAIADRFLLILQSHTKQPADLRQVLTSDQEQMIRALHLKRPANVKP